MQTYGYATGCGLVGSLPLLRRLDAVHDGVTQHVLEWRQHLFEDLAIKLTGCSLDSQFGSFIGLLGNLSYQSCQSRYVTLEWHHARTHQAVLQFGGHSGLLHEQTFGLGR